MGEQSDGSFEQTNLVIDEDESGKVIDVDNLSYEDLDKEIERQIEANFKDLDQLKVDRKSIGDPKKITDAISQIVWEQFILQVSSTAGTDFVKENHDLNLSLKKADHYVNSDDFYDGKMPAHNFENIDKYNQRREKYFSNFQKDENGNVVTHKTRMGTEEATLAKGARKPYDKGRPTGSQEKNTSMDHTVSAGEMMRDKRAGAFLDEDEKIKFANSKANLNEMNRDWNASKGDMSTTDWLNTPNSNGQKPDEIFDMSEADKEKLLNKDKEARAEKERVISEGEKRANKEGHDSRVREFKNSAKFTGQAVAVALMAKLTKTIFQEVILWLKEKDRKSRDLIEHIRKAIHDFIFDFKNNILLSIDVAATTILTQLFGEIIPMIKKALMFFNIGGKSVADVAKYMKDPANAEKDTYTKTMEVGEIFVTSLTAASGIALGMGITYALTKYVPPLAAFQIPMMGSAAGLLGIFFGGLTAGICGAIIMTMIEGRLSGKMLNENAIAQIEKTNEILRLQNKQFENCEKSVDEAAANAASNIRTNHTRALERLEEIKKQKDEPVVSDNEDKFNELNGLIAKLDF